MKLVSCTMWILIGLLALATFDTIPDPPAVTPRTVVSQVPQADLDSLATAEQPCPSLVSSDVTPAFSQRAEPRQANRPHDRIVLTGQAGDPSPPAQA